MYVILYVKCSVLFTYQTNCNISRTKSDMKKNYRWSSFIISRVLSMYTYFHVHFNNFSNGYLLTMSISNEQSAVRPAPSVPK